MGLFHIYMFRGWQLFPVCFTDVYIACRYVSLGVCCAISEKNQSVCNGYFNRFNFCLQHIVI